jgi:exopolyphosphatase/pppGpp-phosphohydrolase
MFRFNQTLVAADPLYPATNGQYAQSAYMVLDAPLVGFTDAEQAMIIQAVVDTLDQTSGAAITKLVNGQT